tara:strand:- start:280 stop:2406 length:2127 start_codon:yes stop_codon:yes gene_type:complete
MSETLTSELFGSLTFNDNVMREKLPRDVYRQLKATVHEGKTLDRNLADTIAHGIKEWALEMGVTHYCHWFQPLTGSTAEKHDSLLDIEDGQAIERFSGGQLVQGEPDASSFPSGGIRSTFEARGYTAWDPSSPIFIVQAKKARILAIPSVFMSYTGEALDKKTPLLRSMGVIGRYAKEALELFGQKVEWVRPTLGCEQEYFLIPKEKFDERMDLKLCDRTVLGASSPKDQQLDDHYFGQVPYKVRDFMHDLDIELVKLGIPAKTRHNEVAPSQYEIACIYNLSSITADQNQLLMQVIKEVARGHDFEAIFHEKPFAKINGNGKHCNWSLADSEGNNLLDPTKNPREALSFQFFCTAVMQGVHQYEALLRSSIASPGNDHRLGANEAPPAIISVYLGSELTKVVNEIAEGKTGAHKDLAGLDTGVNTVFDIEKDNTDRNRTSPFAFTGNKFEFRAVGGGQSVAMPMTILNVAVGDALKDLIEKTKAKLDTGISLENAVIEIMRDSIKASTPIRFEGDNYSEEWVVEAEKRGLSNNRKTPDALKVWEDDKNIALFSKHEVLSPQELQARYHVEMEKYSTKLQIEATTLLKMVESQLLPGVLTQQSEISSSLLAAQEAALQLDVDLALGEQKNLFVSHCNQTSALVSAIKELKAELLKVESIEDEYQHAKAFSTTVTAAMENLRDVADSLESSLSSDLRVFPDYTDLLHEK